MISTRRREAQSGAGWRCHNVLYAAASVDQGSSKIRREKLAFDDPEALQQLCGSNNSRLKLIERTAGAEVHLRGNEITIEGDERAAETAKSALEQLYELALAGKPLS